ncbi:MAG: hypothetical protein IPL99_28770 [Candidatus Competibacteraceae bacterium]|nr:hypothetical protein [Candidatus Competibacteraceae bacterium]
MKSTRLKAGVLTLHIEIKFSVAVNPLAEEVGKDLDPFDLICHVDFDRPPLTRRERAAKVRQQEVFAHYGPPARAAVGAARAGEQGRGFAVVAGEVRKLAQRSADAAKEIKSLITDSVNKVESGGKLVEQSGQTLKEIVVSVKKVSDIVAEIAAASREQAGGIEQVNKAILSMDQVTQQNAALVEETAAASHAMGEQAQELQKLMGFFTLDQRAVATNRVATAPRSPTSTKFATSVKARPAARPLPVKSQPGHHRRRPDPDPVAQTTPVGRKTTATTAASQEWEEF